MIPSWLLVFLGGGMGSVVRFGVGRYFDNLGNTFPYGTFLSNILACFILGIVLGLKHAGGVRMDRYYLLAVGFCGGFSTFSTFSGEILDLIQNDKLPTALIYIGLSIIVGLVSVYFGFKAQEVL